MLAVQEKMVITTDLDGDGVAEEMGSMSWVHFQEEYEDYERLVKVKSNENEGKDELWERMKTKGFKNIFGQYEEAIQKIIYRRYKHVYRTGERGTRKNPLPYNREQEMEILLDATEVTEIKEYDFKNLSNHEIQNKVNEILENNPEAVIIPDRRVRRLQHLLVDLVDLLDKLANVENIKHERTYKKCTAAEKCRCKDCDGKDKVGFKPVGTGNFTAKHAKTWPMVSKPRLTQDGENSV